jgi:hypothetical protein
MPLETQTLYFHLCLKADDDGVVEAYPILKVTGVANDSLRILVSKNFVYPLDRELVLYVVAWNEHNRIRPDRLVKSIYRNLLVEKLPDVKLLDPKPRVDVEDNSRRLGGQSTDAIGQVKLSKSNLREELHLHKKYLLEIPEADLLAFRQKYEASTGQIKRKGEQMHNYCEANGRVYKNYRAFLENGLDKDFGRRTKQVQRVEPSRALSPEEIAAVEMMKQEISAMFKASAQEA